METGCGAPSGEPSVAVNPQYLWCSVELEVGQYAPEVLDLEQWTEDSGISSDDTIDRMRRLGQSSGEDSRNNSDENLYKDQMFHYKMKDIVVGRMYVEPSREEVHRPPSSDSERASPPLYEVELTASDEDDDASVLELVIPIQSSRYQRVPTSSPKKTKPKIVKRYFCSLMCCGRTRK
ncbi:unnamed protein product [Arctia plantaginis]|uniref:Uncharacterized protein n=1 Tax=Arctia plantaginis TaxID=874455 RepID=A0A8S1BIX6_ARCPL|nr:unnamed protein product [Arctia plantaginis]